MIELAILVLIIAFSFAIYYLTNVSTKETSFEKVLEEQRQSQISIVDVTSQKQKKPKKRKKKTDDESLKKEICSKVTVDIEEKLDTKILSNKENEKKSEKKLVNKKECENNSSKLSEEILALKANLSKKDTGLTNKNNQENFIIGQKIINSKVESKKVEKIQQNNIGVDNVLAGSDATKSIEKHEQNKYSKSKRSSNSENNEKHEQIKIINKTKNINNSSDSIDKQEQNKSLKQKHVDNSKTVQKQEQTKVLKEKDSSNLDNDKHAQNKPLKQKHIEKQEQNKTSKTKNKGISDNVDSLSLTSKPISSIIEIKNKDSNNKVPQKADHIINNNYQKSKKPSVDIVGQLTEVNKLDSSTVKDLKKKVGSNASAASVDLSYSKLKHIIQKSQFTGSEIQFLIEVLLNKQLTGNTGGEWIEKGKIMNPASQLQRELDEYKSKLNKECETSAALLAKISSLRNDLNSERRISKNFQEELKSSSALLQQKLNELSAAHKEQLSLQTNEIKKNINQELQLKLAQKDEQYKAEYEINIQKYKSNLADIERQLQQLQSAHQSSEMNCEKVRTVLTDTQHQLNTVNQEREELLQTCQTYQQHLSNIKEQTSEHELRLNNHLYEVQQKLKTSEASELQLISKMNQLSEDKERCEQQLRSYESARDIFSQNQIKLEKIVKENKEFKNQVQTYENDIYNLHELLREKELEVHHLKEENNEISAHFRPVNNAKENGVHRNSFSPEDKICSCCKKNFASDEGDDIIYETTRSLENGVKISSVKKKEASSETTEEKIKIVEKIIEKVIQDPLTLEQLQESKRENDKMKLKIESLTEEKRLLEENLKKEETIIDQSKVVEDLQIENKSLAEKVDNYQLILSNTETLLKSLQKSVENEEHTWREKLLQNEETLRQLSEEKEHLVLEVHELRTSLQNVEASEKVESELNLIKEKLELETKAKSKLKEELISVQEQLKSANTSQCDRYGTPDGILQNEFDLSQKDTESIASSLDQVPLQPEKKKKKNGKLASDE